MTTTEPSSHHNPFARLANFMGFSSHRQAPATPNEDADWIHYNGPYEPPAAWDVAPPSVQHVRALPTGSASLAPTVPSVSHADTSSTHGRLYEPVKRARSSSRSKVLNAIGLSSISPSGSPRQAPKAGGPQPSFMALDAGLFGGIGESPQPVVRERDKDRPQHFQPHHQHTTSISRRGSEPAVSSTSPPIAATSPPPNVMGGVSGARSSLLGFGTPYQTSQTLASQFHNPRKAPIPPSFTTASSAHPYATAALPLVPPRSREYLQYPGGSNQISLFSNRPRNNSLIPPSEAEEASSSLHIPKPALRKRAATHSADASPTYGSPPPPLPTLSYSPEKHPYASALSAFQYPFSTLPPSFAPHSTFSQNSPEYLHINPHHHPVTRATVPQYLVTPPLHAVSSAAGNKPPIPPKSAATVRAIQEHRSLKTFSSTPNLKGQGRSRTQDAQQSPPMAEKGKDREYGGPIMDGRAPPPDPLPPPPPPPAIVTSLQNDYPLTPGPLSGHLQAQTICDAFMFPKPRFVAHVISPPTSPPAVDYSRYPVSAPLPNPLPAPWNISPPPTPLDLEKVVQEGAARERERSEWADKAQRSTLTPNLSLRSMAGSGRLRSRTLSGHKSHNRGPSDGKDGSETGTGARIAKSSGSTKTLKFKRSLDFLMAAEKSSSFKQGHRTMESNATSNATSAGTSGSKTTQSYTNKSGKSVMGKGKAGKLSLSLVASGSNVNGTGPAPNTNTTSPSSGSGKTHSRTHSRKSSNTSKMGAIRAGSVVGGAVNSGVSITRAQSALAGARTHSRNDSGTFSGGWAIRKAKSFCVANSELSPAEENASFTGEKSPSLVGDTIFVGEHHLDSQAKPYSPMKPGDVPEDALVEPPFMLLQPNLEEDEMEEGNQEEEHSHGPNDRGDTSGATLGYTTVQGPNPSPSPAPSGYTGVGIALGTPSATHPYAQLPEPGDFPVSVSTAGPHLSTNTTMSLPRSGSPSSPRDVVFRHRLPPTKAHQAERYLHEQKAESRLESMIDDADTNVSTRGIAPPSPKTQNSVLTSPPASPQIHPFAASTPKASKTSGARGRGFSTNSVEAFFGAEMLESTQSVSPWLFTDAKAAGADLWELVGNSNARPSPVPPPLPLPPPIPKHLEQNMRHGFKSSYRDSDDSGIGSSTEVHLRRSAAAMSSATMGSANTASSQSRVESSIMGRRKESTAPTISSASLLVESPPPSLYPSVRRKPISLNDDAMTFGGRQDDDSTILHSPPPFSEQDRPQPPQMPAVPSRIPGPSRGGFGSLIGKQNTPSSDDSSPFEESHVLGSSSDDLEVFKDLFYVPRSRAPTQASLHSSNKAGDSIREGEGEGRPDADEDDEDEFATESELPFDPDDESTGEIFEARRLSLHNPSPLPSPESGWANSGRIMSPLSAFNALDRRQPSRPETLPDSPVYYGISRASVYNIPEEHESDARSSMERITDENFRLGVVDAVQLPNMTDGGARRHSTQLSLVDDHGEGGNLPDLPSSILAPTPRSTVRIPTLSFLDDPAVRASFLTTTSGASARMSHIISDFPPPPQDLQASFLEYYGASPIREAPNPLSNSSFAPNFQRDHPDNVTQPYQQ